MSYYGGDHRGTVVNVVNWSFAGITIVIIAIRVVSRTILTRNLGFDDILTLFSLAVFLAYVSVLSVAIAHGHGNRTLTIPEPDRSHATYLTIVAACIGCTTFAWVKLAVVALLERLLGLGIWTRVVFWTLASGLCICSLVMSGIWYAQCSPRAALWDDRVKGRCLDPHVLGNVWYFTCAYAAALDLLWAIYPPFVIARLHMARYKKILYSAALMHGVLGCIIVLYKMGWVSEIAAAEAKDFLWSYTPLLIWTTIHAAVLLIGTSLPTIGPFIRLILCQQQPSSYTGGRYTTNPRSPRFAPKTSALLVRLGISSARSAGPSSQRDDVALVDIAKKTDVDVFEERYEERRYGVERRVDAPDWDTTLPKHTIEMQRVWG